MPTHPQIRTLPVFPDNLPLYDLLRLFEMGRSHMAILVKPGPGYDSSSSDDEDYSEQRATNYLQSNSSRVCERS